MRKEWLGRGSTKSYDAETIASIDAASATQNGTFFGVTLKLKDGSTRMLGSSLPDRQSAEIVAAKMMADLQTDQCEDAADDDPNDGIRLGPVLPNPLAVRLPGPFRSHFRGSGLLALVLLNGCGCIEE